VRLASQSSDHCPLPTVPAATTGRAAGAICPVFAQPFAGDERILQAPVQEEGSLVGGEKGANASNILRESRLLSG